MEIVKISHLQEFDEGEGQLMLSDKGLMVISLSRNRCVMIIEECEGTLKSNAYPTSTMDEQ